MSNQHSSKVLLPPSASLRSSYALSKATHLLSVDTPVLGLDDDEALASDVQTGALNLLDAVGSGVLESGDNLLHFGG